MSGKVYTTSQPFSPSCIRSTQAFSSTMKNTQPVHSHGYKMGVCIACEREIEISDRGLCLWLCEPLIPQHIPKEQYRRYYVRVNGWKGMGPEDV